MIKMDYIKIFCLGDPTQLENYLQCQRTIIMNKIFMKLNEKIQLTNEHKTRSISYSLRIFLRQILSNFTPMRHIILSTLLEFDTCFSRVLAQPRLLFLCKNIALYEAVL